MPVPRPFDFELFNKFCETDALLTFMKREHKTRGWDTHAEAIFNTYIEEDSHCIDRWNAFCAEFEARPNPLADAFSPAEVYSLCEAVADISSSFIVSPFVPNDSREMTRLSIEWAQEFERKHSGTDWNVDGDYIAAIDRWFSTKYAQWAASTKEKHVGPFAGAPNAVAVQTNLAPASRSLWLFSSVDDGTFSIHRAATAPDPVAHDILTVEDARLIAAAPELLEALRLSESFANACVRGLPMPDAKAHRDTFRAAIAKVEGCA